MNIRYLAGEDLGLAERDFDLFPVTLLPDFCESGVLLLDLSRSSSESLLSSWKEKENNSCILNSFYEIEKIKGR